MTLSIEQAHKIIDSEPGPDDKPWTKSALWYEAKGFIKGWDAAVRKCAEIALNHECESPAEHNGYTIEVCKRVILEKMKALSPPITEQASSIGEAAAKFYAQKIEDVERAANEWLTYKFGGLDKSEPNADSKDQREGAEGETNEN